MDIWQEAVGGADGGVFAADQGLDSGSSRAGEDGDRASELDQVCNADAGVAFLHCEKFGRDRLESVVLAAVQLVGGAIGVNREDERAVTASCRSLGDVPRSAVVEGLADGSAGIVVTLAIAGVEEQVFEFHS